MRTHIHAARRGTIVAASAAVAPPCGIKRYVKRLMLAALATFAVLATAGSASALAAPGLPADWVQRGSGEFYTYDSSDMLSYKVERNAVNPAVVDFRLRVENRCMWRKTLIMPDGQGSQWPIVVNPSEGIMEATNGLWAHQVRNGQTLKLYKAGFFGWDRWVLNIGHLGDLQPGSRVVFTWLADGSPGNC